MSAISYSFAKSLMRVSKRHVVSDIVDRIAEQERIKQEKEEFATLKEIAEYCIMRLSQRVDANGNEQYVIFEPDANEKNGWVGIKYFDNLDEAKQYLIDTKKRMDDYYDQGADKSAHQAEREGM